VVVGGFAALALMTAVGANKSPSNQQVDAFMLLRQ
jgi:hypothetical protein